MNKTTYSAVKTRRVLLHDLSNAIAALLSLLAAGAFFLPFVCASPYASFPPDNTYSLSAFQLADGFTVMGIVLQYGVCAVLLALPLLAAALSLALSKRKHGIPYTACLLLNGLDVLLLVFLRQLIETLAHGYRAYVYFDIGWFVMLYASLCAVLLSLVSLFSAALWEAKNPPAVQCNETSKPTNERKE